MSSAIHGAESYADQADPVIRMASIALNSPHSGSVEVRRLVRRASRGGSEPPTVSKAVTCTAIGPFC